MSQETPEKSHGMTYPLPISLKEKKNLVSGCYKNNTVGKDVWYVVVFEACTPNWVHPKTFYLRCL